MPLGVLARVLNLERILFKFLFNLSGLFPHYFLHGEKLIKGFV